MMKSKSILTSYLRPVALHIMIATGGVLSDYKNTSSWSASHILGK